LGEPSARRIDPLVDSFIADVGKELTTPFVFFGHSMGGVIAYEIARRLEARGARGPEMLFVSASEPPHLPKDTNKVYALADDQLVEELRSWNGTAEQVFSDPALLNILLPIMRADLEMLDHFSVTPADSRLGCRIVAFGGTRDRDMKRDDLMKWRDLTDDQFDLHMIEGDHFFINSNPPRMRGILTAELARLRPRHASTARLRTAAGGGAP
jgi:medium-chain acyl-[acyl-carrier-protein] hydrolase